MAATTGQAWPLPETTDSPLGPQAFDNLGQAIDDDVHPLLGYAQRSAPTGYSNNTSPNSWISINFNQLDQADTGFAGNGRGIQVTAAGLYLVYAQIGFDNSSGSRGIRAYVGPTDSTGEDFGAKFVTYLVNAHRLAGTWVVPAAASDTIYIQHFTTATPTVSTGGTPLMVVRRLV